LNAKVMETYKAHGVNPFASCLPTLVQIPFLIGVYQGIQMYEIAFGKGSFLWIGSSLANGTANLMGVPVIAKSLAMADVPLCAVYMVTQYVTMKLTPAQDKQQQQTQNMMAIMMSVMFFWMFLTYRWSSAFVLYWLALNILSIYQQYQMIIKPDRSQPGTAPHVGPPASPLRSGGNGAGSAPAVPSIGEAPVRVRPRKKKR
jgi:YidC/Oxa1 family membrane protein insertase